MPGRARHDEQEVSMILIALALQAAAPSPEAVDLGTRLARAGSIMSLLPLVAKKETEEVIAAHPELSVAEKQKLRDVAATTFAAGTTRIAAAFGQAYAKRLGVAELRTLVAQAESPAQRRLRAIQPSAMAEAITAVGTLDFKKDVTSAFCRDTGKLCPASPTK
jgi:hypothetical protein